MSFGSRMTQTRKEKRISQEGLAKQIGATPTTIGRYERDEVKPSIDVAAKIAQALEVSLDYLTGMTTHNLKDQYTIRRLEEITQLPSNAKNQIFMVVDALIRDFKTKQAYSQ